MEFFCHCLP